MTCSSAVMDCTPRAHSINGCCPKDALKRFERLGKLILGRGSAVTHAFYEGAGG